MHATIQVFRQVRQTRLVRKLSSVAVKADQTKKPRKKQGTSVNEANAENGVEIGTPRLRMAASLNNKKHRERHHRIILEGWRLISEALMAKAKPVAIFYTDSRLLDHISAFKLPNNCLAKVSRSTMQEISNAITPPGVVGMFKRPRQGEGGTLKENDQTSSIPLTVLCDGLRDPTNVGTLVRICASAGCESLKTSTGCVDVWDPKVLRCAAGGHFHVPIHYNLGWEEIKKLVSNKRIFLADSNVPAELNLPTSPHYQVNWTLGSSVLVIGGETTGLGETAKELAIQNNGQIVHVPMASKMDSLSAAMAGTVIIYEAYRQVITEAQTI